MTAVDRREEILDYLAANRSATAPELAVRYQVCVRTIWRDLEWLSHGYPLEIIPGERGRRPGNGSPLHLWREVYP